MSRRSCELRARQRAANDGEVPVRSRVCLESPQTGCSAARRGSPTSARYFWIDAISRRKRLISRVGPRAQKRGGWPAGNEDSAESHHGLTASPLALSVVTDGRRVNEESEFDAVLAEVAAK